MSRLTPIKELDAAQRALFEAITTGKRRAAGGSESVAAPDGELRGPFGPWLRTPALGMVAQRLGEALRFEGALPDRERELAILCVAARSGARYEWWAHARIGLAAGLPEAVVSAIRGGERPAFDGQREELVYDVAQALLADHTLPGPLYAQAVAALGEPAVVELVLLVGYYLTVSMTLNTFAVPVPAGQADPFAD